MLENKELLSSVMNSLRLARIQEKALERQLEDLRSSIVNHLEETLKALGAKEMESAERQDLVVPTSANENLQAIIGLLREQGGTMRRKNIAWRAYKEKRIVSTRGADGVAAIVGNVLGRNERLFVSTGWGWWDLAERKRNQALVQKPDEKLVEFDKKLAKA